MFAKRWIVEFWMGFTASWHGYLHMRQHPGLWKYTFQCIGVIGVLYAILIGLVVAGGWYYADLSGWSGFGRTVGLILVLVLVAGVLFFLIPTALRGYFYGQLAEKVAIQVGMPADQIKAIPWQLWIIDAVRDASVLMAINAVLLLMGCVPLLNVISTVAFFYINAFVLGREYLDFPLDMHGLRLKEKVAFAREHRPATLGLGLMVVLFYFLPVINLVLLATSTTGAVWLHRQLEVNLRESAKRDPDKGSRSTQHQK